MTDWAAGGWRLCGPDVVQRVARFLKDDVSRARVTNSRGWVAKDRRIGRFGTGTEKPWSL